MITENELYDGWRKIPNFRTHGWGDNGELGLYFEGKTIRDVRLAIAQAMMILSIWIEENHVWFFESKTENTFTYRVVFWWTPPRRSEYVRI